MYVELLGDGPTYLRVYRGLRLAIVAGRLPAGAALPSTRELATKLDLSRNTILRAYEQLIAEGFAIARPGGGTYVANDVVATTPVPVATSPIELAAGGRRIVASMADNPFADLAGLPPVPYDFLFGVPDASLFPLHEWRKIVSRCIDRASKRTLGYDVPAGVPKLRELIAAHLVKHRGVRCDPSQIVIVAGAQQAFDLVARVLIDPGDHVLVEDPCYPAVRVAWTAAGAKVVAAPVDEEGIDLEAVGPDVRDRCKLAYVTPSHQFPGGAVMSAARRRALLDWASRTGAVIVEDDYDGDYRHAGSPIQALQGLDEAGRVVHVGTFSKSLFPSLRLAYVVPPPALVAPLTAAKWIADWSSSGLLQQALAEFIEAGHFARHLRRSGAVYARRRDALLSALERELGPDLVVTGGQAGMHVVAWLPRFEAGALLEAVARARGLGVGVYPVSAFYDPGESLTRVAAVPGRAGLVLGYSGLGEPQIRAGIGLLGQALRA